MSVIENTLTWIGHNKLASFLSLLCFILFISTIAMGVQKGEWEEKAKVCQNKLITTTTTTTPKPNPTETTTPAETTTPVETTVTTIETTTAPAPPPGKSYNRF